MNTTSHRPALRDRACLTASAALAALLAAAPPSTARTPVGYDAITIHANTTSLIGTRNLSPISAGGIIDEVAGTVITDNQVNFSSISLPSGGRYVIEMNSGPAVGRVIDIISASGNTLTLAEAGGASPGTSYSIRALLKLSQIWGGGVPAEFTQVADFNPDSGDLILIPDGQGRFKQYYYSSHPSHVGYVNAGTGMAEDPYIHYTDALLIQRRSAGFVSYLVGEVKSTNTAVPLTRRFNPVCSMDPEATLTSLGLAATVQAGSEETADIVWSQDLVTGQMNRYFYSDDSSGLGMGWRKVDAFDGSDQGGIAVSSGLIIRCRGPLPHTVVLAPSRN